VLLPAYTNLGGNLLAEGQYKQAAAVLAEGNRYYRPARETPPVFDQRLNYLNMLAEAAKRSHYRELTISVERRIGATQQRYRALSAALAEKEKRRAEILAGVEES